MMAIAFLPAQTPAALADFNPRFEVFELPGGAWGNSVQGMVQDSLGFLWFASQAGLYRYDGQRFVTYRHDPDNDNSPGSDYMEAIFLDSKGVLWLGHLEAGLTRFDPATNTFTRYRHDPKDSGSLSNDWVSSIAEDRQGNIWVATVKGLNRLQNAGTGKWQHYLNDPAKGEKALHTKVRRLYLDKKGTLWAAAGFYIGDDAGLCRYHPETDAFSYYLSEPGNVESLTHSFVGAMLEDSKGNFWVGTEEGGLHWMDRNAGTFIRLLPSSGSPVQLCAPFLQNEPFIQRKHMVSSFFEDQAERIWTGSAGGGLNVYDPDEKWMRHFEAQPGQPGSMPENVWINWIFQSSDGVIWIGSGDELVVKVNPEGNLFPFYPIPGLQNDANISCLLEDKSGRLWVGLMENSINLMRFDRKSRTVISFPFNPAPGKFQAKNVFDLMQDKEGFLWVGTENGLFRVNPQTFHFQHFQHRDNDPESLSSIWIGALLQDRQGRIWAAGEGLNLYDPKKEKFLRFLHDPAAPQTIGGNIVTSLHEDRHGNIWVGGGYGYPDPSNPLFLDRFNPEGTFTHFAQTGVLGNVNCIVEDRRGNFWFACSWLNDNLQRFEQGTGIFTKYPLTNIANSSNSANSLLATKNGEIWILTDNALVALDPDSVLFQSYAADFGIRVIGHGVKQGMAQSAAGEVFFIGKGGFYTFFPEKIPWIGNNKPGFVYITSLKVSNEPVFPGKNAILEKPVWQTSIIRLAHDQSDFSFHLANFNYRNPESSRIEFMLENYDNSWRNDLFQGEATYLKVPPGEFTFRTSSVNNQGIRTEGAIISVIISPPWWRTWWAYLCYVTFFSGVTFSLYRFQLNRRLEHAETLRLHELDTVKTKLYTNITHEFRTPLTVILGMARQVLDNPKEYFRYGLDMIIRNGHNLLELVNQMLDLSKLESGKLSLHLQQGDVVNFLKYLVESFHSLAESKDIKIHFLNDVEALTMDFDAERLQQVVSNLLSNAVKFTQEGGHVYVSVGSDRRESHTAGRDGNLAHRSQSEGGSSQTLVIKVKDTGIGISEEHLTHIFDRFYQTDDTDTGHSEGTGIGLALAKELAKLMKGDIVVRSTPGKGSEFVVTLPVRQVGGSQSLNWDERQVRNHEAANVHHAPAGDNQASAEKPLVLLAEDNDDVVAYLASCLAADYRLSVAKNGQECEEMAIDIIPDLIVTDVMMPHKNGFDACETLKKDERTSHIPIIMLTAKADLDSRLEGLERGADAYLMKPFHKEELLVRIKKLLELRQQLQQHYLSAAGLGEAGAMQDAGPSVSNIEHAFVAKARGVVEAHLDDSDFDVKQLCRALNLSHSQAHRKLSALTGLAVVKFIRSIRLNKAKSLLMNPELSITAVAFDSGFSDPSYFGKIFKQEFGLTPVEWRERHCRKH